LGDFSPIGRLFTLGTFLNYRGSNNFGIIFSILRVCNVDIDFGLGQILGDFFTDSQVTLLAAENPFSAFPLVEVVTRIPYPLC
jgi:hypothetical protein